MANLGRRSRCDMGRRCESTLVLLGLLLVALLYNGRPSPQLIVHHPATPTGEPAIGTGLRQEAASHKARLAQVPSLEALGSCEANCSSHGHCMPQRTATAGWRPVCACAPGWSGTACAIPEPSPCNTFDGGRVLSRCAGHCDTERNKCVCGPDTKFPLRSMAKCEYNGVAKEQPWKSPGWGRFAQAPKTSFWDPSARSDRIAMTGHRVAWCEADPALRQRPMVQCQCYDGTRSSRMCEP